MVLFSISVKYWFLEHSCTQCFAQTKTIYSGGMVWWSPYAIKVMQQINKQKNKNNGENLNKNLLFLFLLLFLFRKFEKRERKNGRERNACIHLYLG